MSRMKDLHTDLIDLADQRTATLGAINAAAISQFGLLLLDAETQLVAIDVKIRLLLDKVGHPAGEPVDLFDGRAIVVSEAGTVSIVEAQQIQGYVPTITNRGKRQFVTIDGKLTRDFLKAYCVTTSEEAYSLARSRGESIYDVPGAMSVDGNCQLVEPQPVP